MIHAHARVPMRAGRARGRRRAGARTVDRSRARPSGHAYALPLTSPGGGRAFDDSDPLSEAVLTLWASRAFPSAGFVVFRCAEPATTVVAACLCIALSHFDCLRELVARFATEFRSQQSVVNLSVNGTDVDRNGNTDVRDRSFSRN